MKFGFTTIGTLAFLTACSGAEDEAIASRSGVIFDSATTGVGLAAGFTEANGLVSGLCGNDPLAVGLCLLGGKLAMEKVADEVLVKPGHASKETVIKSANTVGFLGGCNNLALIAGANPPIAVGIGVACASIYASKHGKPATFGIGKGKN